MSNPNMGDSETLRDTIADNVKDSGNIESSSIEKTGEKPDTQPVKEPNTEAKETKADETKEPETDAEQAEAFAAEAETQGKTPEELREIYKNYQKAYTQRRQREKEEIKEMREKLAKYEAQPKEGEVKSPDLQEAQAQAEMDFDMGKLTPKEFALKMREILREDARRIAQEEFDSMFTVRADREYQQDALKKFNSIDNRFDQKYINPDSPEFNETNAWMYQTVAGQMAEALEAHMKAHNGSSLGFDTEANANKFIKAFDARIDAIVKNRVKSQTQAITDKSVRFQKSNPKGTTHNSVTQGNRDLRSAIADNMS